jgi:hypothetical protein
MLASHRNNQISPQKKPKTNPQGPKPFNPKPTRSTPTLQHLNLSFPSPRGYACIAVVNGAFQHLSPSFDLKTCTIFNPMEILFNGIQNREGRIFILNTIRHPIQGHVGRTDTQGLRGVSFLPNPNLIPLIPHNNLSRLAKTYWPLLRLDQAIRLEIHTHFSDWKSVTTQRGGNTREKEASPKKARRRRPLPHLASARTGPWSHPRLEKKHPKTASSEH